MHATNAHIVHVWFAMLGSTYALIVGIQLITCRQTHAYRLAPQQHFTTHPLVFTHAQTVTPHAFSVTGGPARIASNALTITINRLVR